MHDEFTSGMGTMFGILIIMAFAIFLGVQVHSCSNELSHRELGSLGHACFANKTCRTDKPMRCAENGSASGICVSK